MLPDHLFSPLDLDAALDRAYDKGEERAAWELLAEAVMDPRARGDAALMTYVEVLVDEYTLDGWESDTLDLLRDLADVEPVLRGPLRTPMAEMLAQLGDSAQALRLLRARHDELAKLPIEERDEEFYPAAAMIAGPVDPPLARAFLDDALELAMVQRRPAPMIKYLTLLRNRFGGTTPPHVERYLADLEPAEPAPDRTPEPRAVQPVVAKKPTVRLPYREGDDLGELERAFRAADLESRVAVVRLKAGESVEDADPELDVPWPPGRNEPCWCGSGRKYKKCCGSPV